MKYSLLLALASGLLLTDCSSKLRATTTGPERYYDRNEGTPLSPTARTPYEAAPDSIKPDVPFDTTGRRAMVAPVKPGILTRWRQQFQRAANRTVFSPVERKTKCKNCTTIVNNVTGNQSNNTAAKNAAAGDAATSAAKASGPVASNGSTAKDQSNAGVASDITGDNNAPKLSNAPVEALGWQAQLAKSLTGPAGMCLGAIGFIFFLAYCGPRLLARFKRSKDNTPTA